MQNEIMMIVSRKLVCMEMVNVAQPWFGKLTSTR